MPYDRELAERVRAAVGRGGGVAEKKMFGGVGWLLDGNMCVGVWEDALVARVGDGYADALREPHVRAFDITGRPMRGWVLVGPDGVATDDQLRDWVGRCFAFVRTLPAKGA